MANVFAVHSVGASVASYLTNAYPEPLRTDHPCVFRMLASGEFESFDPQELGTTALTLFLYRIGMSEHRAGRLPGIASGNPLSLELHYLMTVWAGSALAEQTILAWAMSEIHDHPLLDVSYLSPEAGWSASDVVQVVVEEISLDNLMTLWQTFTPAYRLSVSYVARVITIDGAPNEEFGPVVATRFQYTDREALPR